MNKIKEQNTIKEFNTIKEIIYNSAEKYKERIAFVIKKKNNKRESKEFNYKNISYQKLLEDINKLGTAFYNIGLKGKRIAIIGKNRYEWVISHLANMLGGMVSVPLDKDLQYDELENSLIRSKADCIIFDEKHLDKIESLISNNKTNLSNFICMSKIEGFKSVEELLEEGEILLNKGENGYKDYKINENEMAILLFTSGTTSSSKAVMLSQKKYSFKYLCYAMC